jgi:hypothetical protein
MPSVRWLGLFFCFCIPLGAQENPVPATVEISGAAGSLLVQNDGAANYWHSGLRLTLGQNFFLGFDLGKVSSSLPWFNGSAFGFRGQCGVDTPQIGFTLTYGFFKHSPVEAAAEKVVITNDGGQGYFFSIEAPLRFGFFSIVPHFLYGEASWNNGELYWFFGKPDIPSLLIYGADFYFDHDGDYGRYQHGPGFRVFRSEMNIVSNDHEPLFDTKLNAGLFWYQCSLEREQYTLGGTLGWFYVDASLEGALTSSNQPYFLFPYLFAHVDAYLKAHAGFALLRFRYNQKIFQYRVGLGTFHVFYDRGEAEVHYRKKKLFGGGESFEKIYPEISGLGAAFLLLEAGIPALPVGSKQRLAISLQKAFVVPWGYKNLFSFSDGSSGGNGGSGGGKPSGDKTLSLIKTALLSGLSIRGSLSW